jgi:hypothetical protein
MQEVLMHKGIRILTKSQNYYKTAAYEYYCEYDIQDCWTFRGFILRRQFVFFHRHCIETCKHRFIILYPRRQTADTVD